MFEYTEYELQKRRHKQELIRNEFETAGKYQIPLIFLTMGKDGSRAYYKDLRVEKKGFTVKAIETTGAGDTFCGCAIHGLLTHGMDGMNEEVLGDILTYANAGAALITMKKGAIRSMPDPENITKMIEEA